MAATQPDMREGSDSTAGAGRVPGPGLIAIVLIAIVVRAYRIGEPFGGFHGFNEAFYAGQARAYLGRPLIELFTRPLDFNNPPLFTLLLRESFAVFGVSEAAARMVPLVASVAAVAVAGQLAASLLGPATGAITALLLAVSPAFVLVGRNVQVDMVALLFVLAFLHAYVRGAQTGRLRLKLVAGVFLGLALLGKLPAMLALVPVAAFELERRRDLGWLNRGFAAMLGVAGAVAGSWYGLQLLLHRNSFLSSQGHLLSTRELPDAYFWKSLFASELWWGLSPPVCILATLGLGIAAVRRSSGTLLWSSAFIAFTAFYAFYHFHTYYLILVVPFAVMACAWTLARLLPRGMPLVIGATALALASTTLTFVLLGGQKYGYAEFRQVGAQLSALGSRRAVYVHPHVLANFGPLIDYYRPGAALHTLSDSVLADPPASSAMVTYAPDTLPADPESHGIHRMTRQVVSPVLFGFALAQDPPNLHRFTIGPVRATRVGHPFVFGIRSTVIPSAFVVVDLDRAFGR